MSPSPSWSCSWRNLSVFSTTISNSFNASLSNVFGICAKCSFCSDWTEYFVKTLRISVSSACIRRPDSICLRHLRRVCTETNVGRAHHTELHVMKVNIKVTFSNHSKFDCHCERIRATCRAKSWTTIRNQLECVGLRLLLPCSSRSKPNRTLTEHLHISSTSSGFFPWTDKLSTWVILSHTRRSPEHGPSFITSIIWLKSTLSANRAKVCHS